MDIQSEQSIAQFKKEHQEQHAAMLKSLGIFFAFDEEQFQEQKQDGVEYCCTDYGMIIPKHKMEEYKSKSREISDKYNKEIAQLFGLDKFIADTLENQETYYSGDLEEALEIVQNTFTECTMEDIERIYNANVGKYV